MRRLAAVIGLTAFFTLLTPTLPAYAEKGCVIDVLGIKVCGDLLTPLPTITIKPSPLPGPTVTVPGPTVHVPGPTKTVTIPGPTTTVTTQPDNPGPSELPTATVTETVPGGQTSTNHDTVTSSPRTQTHTDTETRTKTETIVKYVVGSFLLTLAAVFLGFIAILIGYYLGHKDAERDEKRFLGNMLDYVKSNSRSH